MKSTHKCLKEWNAIIEALGQGKQTILIRHYGTTSNDFLLYPTINYLRKYDYLEGFQLKYRSFVEKNAFPEKDNDKTAIKYYATVKKILEKSTSTLEELQKNYIWTSKHVKKYLNKKKAQIWVLRVYELKEPYFAEPKIGAIKYANLNKNVSLDGIKPVMSNDKFSKILSDIEDT